MLTKYSATALLLLCIALVIPEISQADTNSQQTNSTTLRVLGSDEYDDTSYKDGTDDKKSLDLAARIFNHIERELAASKPLGDLSKRSKRVDPNPDAETKTEAALTRLVTHDTTKVNLPEKRVDGKSHHYQRTQSWTSLTASPSTSKASAPVAKPDAAEKVKRRHTITVGVLANEPVGTVVRAPGEAQVYVVTAKARHLPTGTLQLVHNNTLFFEHSAPKLAEPAHGANAPSQRHIVKTRACRTALLPYTKNHFVGR